MVRGFGGGVGDVARHLRPLLAAPQAQEAVRVLKEDFGQLDNPGPMRAATFITGGPDDDIQADVAGFVRRLLNALQE